MIEFEVISYLKSDVTLDSLLGATSSDSKIYPIQAPQSAIVPYIIYNLPNDGGIIENTEEISISFDCISDDFVETKNIKDRLLTLLDKEDKIRDVISSGTYWYYWCKKVGGASFKEPEQDYFHRVAIFDFLYAPK